MHFITLIHCSSLSSLNLIIIQPTELLSPSSGRESNEALVRLDRARGLQTVSYFKLMAADAVVWYAGDPDPGLTVRLKRDWEGADRRGIANLSDLHL